MNDPLNNYLNNYTKKTKLLISFAAIGVILFVIGTAILPFKDKILNTLYPKKQSKAVETATPLAPNVPATRYGFNPWGITREQAAAQLGSQLTNNGYGYALNPGYIFMIGKGSQNWPDPSYLKLLTDNNLDNMSFSNSGTVNYAGLYAPASWTMSSSGSGVAVIEQDSRVEDVDKYGNRVLINRGTPEGDNKVVKVTAPIGTTGGYTQIAQTLKRAVTSGRWVIFGAWVKADDFPSVNVFLQNPANSQPFPNSVITSYTKENDTRDNDGKEADVVARHSGFEDPVSPPDTRIDDLKKKYFPFKWTFVMGYVQVPAGVTSAQLVLKVGKGRVWFDGAVAAIIDSGATENNQMSAIVKDRLGSAWIIGNEPGAEEDCYVDRDGTSYDVSYFANIRHTPPDIYALIYHQFYTLIKKYDPTAMVMPGGLAGHSAPWDRDNGGAWRTICSNAPYNPKQYLNDFRTAYKTKFQLGGMGVEPPVDAIAIHYYENNISEIGTAANFQTYMQNLKTYMDGVVGWKGKPIWLNEFGTRRSNLTDVAKVDHSAEFAQTALAFLKTNTLNIQKWFWFETCGNAGVSPLFEMQSPGVCKKDTSGAPILTTLGKVWANQDKGPIKVDTSIQVQDKVSIY